MKKITSIIIIAASLFYYPFAQEDNDVTFDVNVLNQFYIGYKMTADATEEEKDAKPDLMPALYSNLYLSMKYTDKLYTHARLTLATGNKSEGYYPRFDRAYTQYTPVELISLKFGMDSAFGKVGSDPSMDIDDAVTTLTEGHLGVLDSSRDIGLWVTIKPISSVKITPYILAPKTKFVKKTKDAKGDNIEIPLPVRHTLNRPGDTSIFTYVGDKEKYAGSTASKATQDADMADDEDLMKTLKVTPYVGLAVSGELLDNNLYLGTFYETSAVNQHIIQARVFYQRKDLFFGVFGETVTNIGSYNVKGQLKTSAGLGVYGYVNDKITMKLAYASSFENPHSDDKLSSLRKAKYQGQLKNQFYDYHTVGLEAKFSVFGGNLLYFTLAVKGNFPGSALKELTDGTDVKPFRDNASLYFNIASKI